MDTISAEGPLAFDASNNCLDLAMVETRQGTVAQGSGGGRFFNFHCGYRDANGFADLLLFEAEIGAAQAQDLAEAEWGFLDQLSVDVSAVGRAKVTNQNGILGHDDLAMKTRHGHVVDAEIIGWVSTQGVETRLQFERSRMGQTC